jgi:soluble lytic murein transglycosylase
MIRATLARLCGPLALAAALVACEPARAPLPEQPGDSTPAPILAPTTLPQAPELLRQALAARAIGDDAAAGETFSVLIQAYPDGAEALTARYYLAESFARRARWSSAAELLRVFLAAAPADHALRGPALFWTARAAEGAGDHAAAVAGYKAYRELGTPIEPYAALRQAAQERALGLPAEAAASYLHAARSLAVRGERAGSFEKAIALLQEAGRPDEALAVYGELLELAESPAYRAGLLADAAALAQSLGQADLARGWLLELVAELPGTPQAAGAADQLLAAADPELTSAEAGGIYISAERWAEAITQLNLAIPVETNAEAGAELRRLRALALRAQGDFPGAIAAFAEASALSPDSQAGLQAQLDLIQTIGQSGETEQAARGYVDYATNHPDDERAPIALDRAAQLRERLGDAEGALQLRLELGNRYPASDEGAAALHLAGLALFQAGRLDEAKQAWQALADGNGGALRARGAYWAGRAALGQDDETTARELFVIAHEAAPESYEGARAADQLGVELQGTIPIGAPIEDAQWAELDAWVAGWAGASTGPAADEALATRAALLEEVGLADEALTEWLDALQAAPDDAQRILQLARGAHAAGLPYAALSAAADLVGLAPETAPPPPLALRRLLYPTPYAELVRREAAERGVDPRLLYALFRQESLFNPAATSWVGARGLAQVMPETGQGIAQNLGVEDFTPDDLYRPAVSVRFGAFYLGQRIKDMSGSIQGALASYNGGLGNAQRWANGSTVADPDLFTETIDYPETKGYVRSVYGFWNAYKGLYAP